MGGQWQFLGCWWQWPHRSGCGGEACSGDQEGKQEGGFAFGGRRKAVRDRLALQGGTGDFPCQVGCVLHTSRSSRPPHTGCLPGDPSCASRGCGEPSRLLWSLCVGSSDMMTPRERRVYFRMKVAATDAKRSCIGWKRTSSHNGITPPHVPASLCPPQPALPHANAGHGRGTGPGRGDRVHAP